MANLVNPIKIIFLCALYVYYYFLEILFTLRAKFSDQQCTWNDCSNQAQRGIIVAAVRGYVCEKHEKAVINISKRAKAKPESFPDKSYWKAVFQENQ